MVDLGFALMAGVLSSLSPCVLPLLPIVFGTATTESRYGPLALALGLAISFTAIGMFVATIGFGLGLSAEIFRTIAAIILIVIGMVLVVPHLQVQVAGMAGPVSNWTQTHFGGFDTSGLHGQFALGLLLGAVWSPCVGPTLGAASVLASRGESLGQVALTMGVFGVGAAVPLLGLGFASRETMARLRGRFLEGGKTGKFVLGVLLVLVGLFIATGLDKIVETKLVELSPAWLTRLTTSL